jgi:hypothetical protein
MTLFRHILWGYEVTYPDNWTHHVVQDSDAFVITPDALDSYYLGEDAGQLLVRGEWNWARLPIEPLWNKHIGMLASMLGAKEVGSAPWRIGDATGLEAEIVLPKKDNRRLWTGVLVHDFRVLHFMVTHPKDVRAQFEPVTTKIIASLRFPNRFELSQTSPEGLPLPPDYVPAEPQSILADIPNPQSWRGYTGNVGIGALQAFYLRELPRYGWKIEEYVPFPGPSELGFARFRLRRDNLHITLGLMPYEAAETGVTLSLAKIMFKIVTAAPPGSAGG